MIFEDPKWLLASPTKNKLKGLDLSKLGIFIPFAVKARNKVEQLLQKYQTLFRKLRVDKTHGIAPHKPVLLLSVLQLFRIGFYTSPEVPLVPELVALFKSNWAKLVRTKHDCRISYPFYYLKSSGFWTLISRPGYPDPALLGSLVKNFDHLRSALSHAKISSELFALASHSASNESLQAVLLDYYFCETKENMANPLTLQATLFDEIEDKILNETGAQYKKEITQLIEKKDLEELYIRGTVFKREIPKIYDYTCCISGMRVDTVYAVSMIDACHIVPFSISYNDTISNGIALCPNLHRAFDRGLVTIDQQYRVLVSEAVRESESTYGIRSFHKKKIELPAIEAYRPALAHFAWHSTMLFKK